MKKLQILVIFVLLFASTGILSAQTAEETPADFAGLAINFPQEMPYFITFRTDEAQFAEINTLLTSLHQIAPEEFPEGLTIETILSEGFPDFENTVRPWLGDKVAVGFSDIQDVGRSDTDVLLVADVTDNQAAEAYVQGLINTMSTPVETIRTDTMLGYIVEENGFIVLGQDIIAITNRQYYMDMLLSGAQDRLNEREGFAETLNKLPDSNYAGVVYVSEIAMQATIADIEAELDLIPVLGQFMSESIASVGAQAHGFALANGRSLVWDVVVNLNETDLQFMEQSRAILQNTDPISLDFANNLPVDTQFYIQGANYSQTYLQMIDSLSLLSDYFDGLIEESYAGGFIGFVEYSELKNRLSQDLGGALNGLQTAIYAGLTGLHLGEDILPMYEGEFGMFLNILGLQNAPIPVTLDFGIMSENVDPERVGNNFQAVVDSMNRYGVSVNQESTDNGELIVIPELLRYIVEFATFPETLADISELDMVLGQNADVFSIGTRQGASFPYAGEGDSLVEDTRFAYVADAIVLDGTQFLLYMSPNAIYNAIADIDGAGNDVEMLQYIDSMTMGTISDADTSSARFTITLSETEAR